MKNIRFLIAFWVCAASCLQAQDTGTAAAESVEITTTSNSNWQNWVFAGSALVAAVIGVVIISTNSGEFNH